MKYPSEAPKELHVERMARLETSVPYYLFQPALLRRLSNISRKKIWISDPRYFNDPLDLRLELEDRTYLGPFGSQEKLREALRVLIGDNQSFAGNWFYSKRLLMAIKCWVDGGIDAFTLECEIKERVHEFGVACFTKNWNQELMWSHYAKSHSGYCVEYCVRELDLVNNNNGNYASFHVQYSSVLPKLCISETLFSPHQTLGRMLATKSAEWAYEREWRLVHLEKKAAQVDMPSGMAISALIAGLKADGKLIQQLIKKSASLKVPAYRVTRDSGYTLRMELL